MVNKKALRVFVIARNDKNIRHPLRGQNLPFYVWSFTDVGDYGVTGEAEEIVVGIALLYHPIVSLNGSQIVPF